MGDENKFKNLITSNKTIICLGALIVLLVILVIASMSMLKIEEYNPTELQEWRDQYVSYDLYAERFNAWANSLYNNDSEPANLSDVMKDDARDVILDMHEGGMSDEEILHALNEPARLAYKEGIVDSPTIYDESFVKEVIDKK